MVKPAKTRVVNPHFVGIDVTCSYIFHHCSEALAQSVRLGGFELVVERSIADTRRRSNQLLQRSPRSIPETLAETGEVKLEASFLRLRDVHLRPVSWPNRWGSCSC